jgi:exosortase/archaeosortase family protein
VLTATRSWPASSNRFILLGIVISLGVFGFLRLAWVEAHALLPLTLAQASLARSVFGTPVSPVNVTLACSGADAIALALGAILAFPAAWTRRVRGAAGALGIILAINIVRIGTLGLAAGSVRWFDALHLYIWPAVLTLSVAGYVLFWMRPAAPVRMPTERVATLPSPSRRFVIAAGVLLIVFISTSPLYLNNGAILAVGAFVARAAAAILSAAGLSAYATGNVLWGPRGGFLVTPECIMTPLIPIYLAAVTAYSPNWKRAALGLAAAAPLFVALGIVRLLVVAVPQSVASQVFFIHAFYQLLVGVLVVGAAAVWRHRDRSAVLAGTAGIATGALFIALAGAAYFPVIAFVAGRPVLDPQGAIAFLPPFQTALYLALAVAAGLNQSWRRRAAGLSILVASQVAVIAALNAIAAHTAVTIAVRDVRGLALAVPILVFAGVVLIGRPRR